jgi:hypothetical protein
MGSEYYATSFGIYLVLPMSSDGFVAIAVVLSAAFWLGLLFVPMPMIPAAKTAKVNTPAIGRNASAARAEV